MSAIYVDNLCGICHNKPPDEDEDYNYECAFCKNFICSECFYPGEAWCEACRSDIKICAKCDAHISSLMVHMEGPTCELHPKYSFH